MRTVDALFGPVGAIRVDFNGSASGGYATVLCRNGLTNKNVSFNTTTEIGNTLKEWIERDKKQTILRDVCPELSAEQREMCISGITPEEWDKMWQVD